MTALPCSSHPLAGERVGERALLVGVGRRAARRLSLVGARRRAALELASFAPVPRHGLLRSAALGLSGTVAFLLLEKTYRLGKLAMQHASYRQRERKVLGRQLRLPFSPPKDAR